MAGFQAIAVEPAADSEDLRPQLLPVNVNHDSLAITFDAGEHQLVFTEPVCEDCDDDSGDDGDDGDGDDPDQGDPTGCSNPFSLVTMIVGNQAIDPNICNAPVRTYWYQEETDQ